MFKLAKVFFVIMCILAFIGMLKAPGMIAEMYWCKMFMILCGLIVFLCGVGLMIIFEAEAIEDDRRKIEKSEK